MMWWPGPNCPLYRPRKSSGTDASLTPIKRNQPVTFSLQSWKKMKFYCLNNWRIIPQLSCCSNALPRSLSLVLHYHSPITEAAAAVAKSLQLCLTLCNPRDSSPPGSPVPGILQVRTLEWVAVSFFNAWKWNVKVKSPCRVRLSATPWTAAHQAPPSMGFSRQEYWSGVPLPSPVTEARHKIGGNYLLALKE